jgi:hypothetical protein
MRRSYEAILKDIAKSEMAIAKAMDEISNTPIHGIMYLTNCFNDQILNRYFSLNGQKFIKPIEILINFDNKIEQYVCEIKGEVIEGSNTYITTYKIQTKSIQKNPKNFLSNGAKLVPLKEANIVLKQLKKIEIEKLNAQIEKVKQELKALN